MKKMLLLAALLSAFAASALPAPDFQITTSDGQVRRLYQDYVLQGKVVVIEAFFTSCPPCATHAPHFQSLYAAKKAAYPGQVEFILLSTLATDNNAKVAAYLSDKMLTMLGAGKDGNSLLALQPYMGGAYGTFLGTPTFWVIAPNTGEVTFDVRGNSATGTMALLGQKIDEYLAPPSTCNLLSPFGQPIDDVQLTLDGPNFDTTITASGKYSVTAIAALQNSPYAIKPHKNGNVLQGLSTYDLVLISKHILGLDTFTQAWKRIAADINCSNTITTFDIVVGRRLILGIDTALACGAWKFISETQGSASNGSCQHFRGIRSGDLNGSYFASSPEDRSTFALCAADLPLRAGQRHRLLLRSSADIAASGLQLALGFDPAALQLRQIESEALPDFGEAQLNWQYSQAGWVPCVWVDGRGAEVPAGQPLLAIEVTALRDGLLSEMLHFQSEMLSE
ncbi:MAG TPA: redoxin domain-containing protein, partial [Saprospiraceae bacterium]|nr:redoxin domain-containing protein [Saprospiraceae bacterium]